MNCEILIIGAGMSGISIAHFLRHRRVLLLERGSVACEATGNNAGFVISGFGEHFHRTVASRGIEKAAEIQRIHLSNHRRIRELATTIDCGYLQTGSIAVAVDDAEAGELYESCRLMQSAGFAPDWIPAPQVGLKTSKGALWNPDDARMESRKFWTALAADLPVRTQCEVRAYEYDGSLWRVQTSQGEFTAEQIVFCLNAFAAELVPELRGRYIPLRGQMLEWPLAAAIPTECPVYSQHGDIYWRYRDRTLIFGGLEDRSPEEETGIATVVSRRITDAQVSWIREHFDEGLLGPAITRTWCSTMAFTIDGFPFVGKLSDNGSYVLSGLCGLGHGYAMECASWLSQLIQTGSNGIPPEFSSDRIKSLPVYSGGPWRKLYEAWNY